MKKEKTEFRDKNKTEKVIDVARTSAIIIGVSVALGIGLFLYLAWPKKTEMTQAEKEWLLKRYEEDEERISKGYLYGDQKGMLEKLRMGMTYLEEKYPGYEFYIHYIDGWAITVYECAVTEKKTGYDFDMSFYKNEDKSVEIKDNFYRYFLEENFDIYLTEQLSKRDKNIVAIDVYMSTLRGKECDINTTLEDIINKRIVVYPRVNVYIAADNLTEEECIGYEQEIYKFLEEIDIPITYDLYFFGMTIEEMLNEDEYKNLIYDNIIHL